MIKKWRISLKIIIHRNLWFVQCTKSNENLLKTSTFVLYTKYYNEYLKLRVYLILKNIKYWLWYVLTQKIPVDEVYDLFKNRFKNQFVTHFDLLTEKFKLQVNLILQKLKKELNLEGVMLLILEEYYCQDVHDTEDDEIYSQFIISFSTFEINDEMIKSLSQFIDPQLISIIETFLLYSYWWRPYRQILSINKMKIFSRGAEDLYKVYVDLSDFDIKIAWKKGIQVIKVNIPEGKYLISLENSEALKNKNLCQMLLLFLIKRKIMCWNMMVAAKIIINIKLMSFL